MITHKMSLRSGMQRVAASCLIPARRDDRVEKLREVGAEVLRIVRVPTPNTLRVS